MIAGIKKKLVKSVLVVGNVFLAAVGLFMFVATILVRYQETAREYAAKKLGEPMNQLQSDMITLAVIGFLMFVVGASGCIGAGLENLIALRAFVVCIILIALTQCSYAVAVACMKGKIKESVYRDIRVFVINYNQQSEEMRVAFDDMQRKGNCCGCNERGDYKKVRLPVPGSCPPSTKDGCCKVVWQNMKTLGAIFGYLALAIVIVEYVAVFLACLLISSLQKCRYAVQAAAKAEKRKKKSEKLVVAYRQVTEE